MTTMTMADARNNFRPARTAPADDDQTSGNPIPGTIRQAVQDAVDAIEDDLLKGISSGEAPPFAQARAALVLLTLCYARKIYSSADAASLVPPDLCIACLCGDKLADACILRRFRADNREAIHCSLTAALHFLVTQKIAAGVVTKASLGHSAAEASRRIIMAMFVDSMELDGQRADNAA